MTEFEMSGKLGVYSIKVSGHDIAEDVEGVEIKVSAHDSQPRVTLHLNSVDRHFAFGDADVRLSDRTIEALKKLGWTPPKESP